MALPFNADINAKCFVYIYQDEVRYNKKIRNLDQSNSLVGARVGHNGPGFGMHDQRVFSDIQIFDSAYRFDIISYL